MTWTRATVAFPATEGVCFRREAEILGALCVHLDEEETHWRISHVGTGLAIPRYLFDTMEEAKAACERVATVSDDWEGAGKLIAMRALPEAQRRALALRVRDAIEATPQ